MTTDIFRKISLERLSSPEQLDHLLNVTDMKSWAALLALALMSLTAVLWSVTGSVVVSAMGRGVVVKQGGGVFNVVSPSNGNVLHVFVNVGDYIQEGQVVATLAQPALLDHLKTLQQTLSEAEQQRNQTSTRNGQSMTLQVAALRLQQENERLHIAEVEIEKLQALQQEAQDDQLLSKGLITKQEALLAKTRIAQLQEQLNAASAQGKQLVAQEFTARQQPRESDAALRDRSDNLKREIASQLEEIRIAQSVVSPYTGQVLERKVDPGSTLHDGDPVLSIQPRSQQLEILAYLPSAHAKELREGMKVQISPSFVKREEFGYMNGVVIYTSEYPATSAEIMRNLQNETLVTSLLGLGPVTEVRVSLDRDAKTASGFSWSTSHGPALVLSSGTLCDIQVITQRKHPIDLLLPFLKKTSGAS